MQQQPQRFSFWLSMSLALVVIAAGCIPPTEEVYTGVTVDLNDPNSRAIYDHQNARNADSLGAYLTHANPSYRYLAARGLASFPEIDAAVVAELTPLLADRDELIRTAAAWAIGQSGLAAAADSLTVAFDGTGNYPAFNAEVLAAVGKTGDEKTQAFLSEISTYTNKDTLMLAGLMRGLFNFAGRKIQSEAGDRRVLTTVLDPLAPPLARRPAAWYLQRYEMDIDAAAGEGLRQLLRTEQDPEILQGIARALGRQQDPAGRVALIRALKSQSDWRVRTEILRALAGYEYGSVREPVVESLRDAHPLVRRAAATFLRDNGVDTEATFYRQLARDSSQTDIRYVLYAAAQRHLPLYFTDYRGFLNYDLQQAYTKNNDAYVRAEIITALGEYPWNYRNIYELYQATDQAPVRTAAAAALGRISQREDFAAFFRSSTRRVRYELSTYFREMIEGLEVGPVYEASGALLKQAEVYRPFYPELSWLDASLNGFKLPRDIESYRAVENARAALLGQPTPRPHVVDAPAKAIDWERIAADAGKEVVLRLPGGRVVMELWPDVAPATVASFLESVENGYYDGKVFHRVVPNFVAQGGGPIGDGFGGADWTIRTETPGVRFNRAGLMGIASAGKDTESVQFYFTHRATPHLNGGYTIFGAVTEGQEAVDNITAGTRIESVSLR